MPKSMKAVSAELATAGCKAIRDSHVDELSRTLVLSAEEAQEGAAGRSMRRISSGEAEVAAGLTVLTYGVAASHLSVNFLTATCGAGCKALESCRSHR